MEKPLKIACLHGYCQNADLFRRKTGAVRKALQKTVRAIRTSRGNNDGQGDWSEILLAELVYLDAPFVFEEASATEREKDDRVKYTPVYKPVDIAADACTKDGVRLDRSRRAWWVAEDDGRLYKGWEQSLEFLKTEFRQNSYDGVLGFSQGAVAASLLCAEKEFSGSSELSTLRFALLYSGFPSRAEAHEPLFQRQMETPSLHTWGVSDERVPEEASRKLLECFTPRRRRVFEHDKGHLVPSDNASRRCVEDFLLDMRDGVLERPEATSEDGEASRACL